MSAFITLKFGGNIPQRDAAVSEEKDQTEGRCSLHVVLPLEIKLILVSLSTANKTLVSSSGARDNRRTVREALAVLP